jgi:hypothetical protein
MVKQNLRRGKWNVRGCLRRPQPRVDAPALGAEAAAYLHESFLRESPRADYNPPMDLLMQVLGPLLEWIFFIGMAGSALVVAISFVEDFYTIFEKD